jgi:hypothetical protein
MTRMPFLYASEPETKPARLKPFLLFALTLAVLGFCATLWLR